MELDIGALDASRSEPMIEMNHARWRYTSAYLRETFGRQDAHLDALTPAAVTAGLPDIAVSPDVGRLLKLLVSMTAGRVAIEVGTLAGYSAIWLARGLRPDGRLITIEANPEHAVFARNQLASADLGQRRVEVRTQAGIEALEALRDELQPGSVDVIFLDAVKREYPAYFELAGPLLAVGGLLIADNALGSSHWWIDQEDDPDREGAHQLNQRLADDDRFEAVAVPIREGVLIARRER